MRTDNRTGGRFRPIEIDAELFHPRDANSNERSRLHKAGGASLPT